MTWLTVEVRDLLLDLVEAEIEQLEYTLLEQLEPSRREQLQARVARLEELAEEMGTWETQ